MDPDHHNLDTDKAVLQAILNKNQEFFQEISKIQTESIQEIKLGEQNIPTSQLSDSVKGVLNMILEFLRVDADYLSDIPELLSKIKPKLDSAEAEVARKGKELEDKKEQKVVQHAVAESKGANFGPYKRPAIENIESQEIGDVICRCDYDFEEIEELINKEEGIKKKLEQLILKRLVNLETKEPLKITMRGDLKKYQIVEEINIADELGEWRFHPFFDRMTVYLVRNGDVDFPVKWHWQVPEGFPSKTLEIKTEKRKSSGKSLSGGSVTLLEFLEELAEKYEKDKSQAKSWAEALNSHAVDTVEELLRWGKTDFDELQSLPKQINLILLQELNRFKFKAMSEVQAKLNVAEKKGIVHKIRRFLCYQTKKEDEEDELGYIDQKVLELAFNEVKTYYEGDSLLEQIKTFYLGYTVPMKRRGNIILERGMILHGPPGTGKTVLTDDLPLKMGLTPISHSLSASEVNRGLVGQTEKLLLDLCNRATKMPHLLCCVSIDEIDSLVPKRDEKSSQYKTDGIAVLLAVIGGIKDVPNLVILASTNRLNQIDDAIKRRLSGQFFVGRPSPASRKKIIQKINNEKNEPNQVIMDEKEIEETVKMTTNFSGAALKMLISKLLVYYKTQKKQGNLTPEEITKYATLTSKQFGIKLGTFYLPDLFQKRLDDQKRGVQENFEAFCTIKQYQKSVKMESGCTISSMLAKTSAKPNDNNIKYDFTGRILVNLSDIVKTTIEYQLKDQLQLLIEERKMMSSTLNDLLPRFADFVAERNIDFIQLFNSDFLLDNNAFDEGKIMENISDKIEELRAYDRALLIIDMDSLCGVNVSKSESGMGSTVSYSLSNAKLFSLSIHSINTKAQITESRERWIALACKNPYLLSIVKESLNWRKTPKQIEQENNEKENNTKERFCKKCAQKYLEVENKLGCCNYHDGFLFQSSKKPEFWEPIIDEALINALKADPKVNDFGLKYICCFEGYTSPGCKKDKHSEHNHNIPNYFDIFVSLKKFKSSNKI